MTDLADFTTRFKQRLSSRWYCEDPVPIADAVLAKLRASTDGLLPSVYVRFLEICGGAAAGRLFDTYHWSPETRVARNKELQLVASEFDASPPKMAFTFVDYIGDYFWGFNLDAGDNPPVWMFDLQKFDTFASTLTEFFLTWDQLE